MAAQFCEKWLVGLTQADALLRRQVAIEGEPATATLRRGLAALATLAEIHDAQRDPRDHVVRYRKPPLAPNWMQGVPMTLLRATAHADQLAARRWEVELHQVEAAVDLPEEDDELDLDRRLYRDDDE